MRQIVVRVCARIILIAAVVSAGWVHVVLAQSTADEHLPEGLGIAQFTPSDELIFPADTDLWVVLRTSSVGDSTDAEFDPKNPRRISVVKMEPNAYAYLLENRECADGTMLLRSFYLTQEKPEPGSIGFVQGNLETRLIHVIDRVKYQDNRGFYLFAADGRGPSAKLPAANKCVQCYAEQGDFDSTFTQFYPTIRHIVSQGPE